MSTIQVFTFNPFQENTYILCDSSKECVIIDPGMSNLDEQDEFRGFIEENNLKPVRLLLTHAHIDHIMGNHYCFLKWGLKPEFHPLDIPTLERGGQSAAMFGIPYDPCPEILPDMSETAVITFGGTELKVLFVPGHAPGHVAFYCAEEHYLIVGDVLFNGSVGRVDLPGCNPGDLVRSIQEKLYVLPDETQVYPGHGPKTTIGTEKTGNAFVRVNSQNLI